MITEDKKALIVQSDNTLLLDVHHTASDDVRDAIAAFSELEKSPEHMHTYRISPLSLWNAASAGITPQSIMDSLSEFSRYPVPENVFFTIEELMSRFGKLLLVPTDNPEVLSLEITDPAIRAELQARIKLQKLMIPSSTGFTISLFNRGTIKQELITLGYPVKDMVPLKDGAPLDVSLRDKTVSDYDFILRDYQKEATRTLIGNRTPGTGFGTIVLPCGAGKTIVGLNIMAELKTFTLILAPNVAAVHQWIDEILDKTNISPDDIGEYTGSKKEIKPITVATYQILVWRKDKMSKFIHFNIFYQNPWGLIIYDEVHLLPAQVFRVTAEIQAIRRVGLTATLVREDGAEKDVFSLVGPKRYDVPWKQLENRGWIAEAYCYEIRVNIPEEMKIMYAIADKRRKFRISSENPAKIGIAKQLIANHPEDAILVIGQYIDQLKKIAKELKAPLITGQTPNALREQIYKDFKSGKDRVIVVSKVANFAIDLPDASMAIQISGSFGSRQEEAQRLGRILRPKKRNATFYSIVSRHTVEEEFAAARQKFLAEQGYKYNIEIWNEDV